MNRLSHLVAAGAATVGVLAALCACGSSTSSSGTDAGSGSSSSSGSGSSSGASSSGSSGSSGGGSSSGGSSSSGSSSGGASSSSGSSGGACTPPPASDLSVPITASCDIPNYGYCINYHGPGGTTQGVQLECSTAGGTYATTPCSLPHGGATFDGCCLENDVPGTTKNYCYDTANVSNIPPPTPAQCASTLCGTWGTTQ